MVGFPWAAKFGTFDLLQRCSTVDSTSGFIGWPSLGKERKVRRAHGKRNRITDPGSVLLPSKGLCSPQACRLPYIKGMMKTEMSSPEPSRSLVILHPRSLSMPRARITRSCAAIVYLHDTGKAIVIPTLASVGRKSANCTPVKVVGVTVGEERGDGFCYFLVGENVPESICSHHQDVVGSVLVVHQVVNFHLKQQQRELASIRGSRPARMLA